jgi:hypothetical protein
VGVRVTPVKTTWKRMKLLSTCLRVLRKRSQKSRRSLHLRLNLHPKSKFYKIINLIEKRSLHLRKRT